MEQLLNFLDTIAPLDAELKTYLASVIRTAYPAKNEFLLREDNVARTIGYIEKGLIRGYRTQKNGDQVTCWFMGTGDVFISIQSFLKQIKARETIQTLEPCIIHSISYNQLQHALSKFPSFHRHRAELLEKYYLLAEERNEMRQQEDACEQYGFLVTHYPDLIDKVPDKYLASFLNMTPSYFSFIQDKYNNPNTPK